MAGYNEDPSNLQPATQCDMCKHSIGFSDLANNLACLAFPNGTPDKYQFDDKKHDKIDPVQTRDYLYEISDEWVNL